MFAVEKKFFESSETLGTASQNGVRVGGLVRMDFRTFSLFLTWKRGLSRKEKKWLKGFYSASGQW